MEAVPQRYNANGSIVLAVGNILLDTLLEVDSAFLEKYCLTPDTTTLADTSPRLSPLFDEISTKDDLSFCPGGCAANTVRVAQWILKQRGKTAIICAVGDDPDSERLTSLLDNEGIQVRCQKVKGERVGQCVVLTSKEKRTRTLVTKLGASVLFNFEDFMGSKDKVDMWKGLRVIYISGYFLRVCMRTLRFITENAIQKKVPVVFNLNAVWVVEIFHKEIKDLLQYVDYLIGNFEEFSTFFQKLSKNVTSNPVEMAEEFLRQVDHFPKTVIITRGDKPIIVGEKDKKSSEIKISEFNPITIPQELIVDTNGAGDAFAGGFISGLSKSCSLEKSIKCGLWAASEVIQKIGCTFPRDKSYDFIKDKEATPSK